MLNNISISVLCPTFNSASFVVDTLKSVISQTVLPNELIIIDDGSTDDTIEIIESFMAKNDQKIVFQILHQKHLGPGAARNTGIKAARSHWIAFLDSDDFWYPNKIEKIKEAITRHPNSNFFCHNELVYNLDGSKQFVDYEKGFNNDLPVSQQLYKKNFFSTSTVVCKLELLNKWNGFNENLSSAQDYELWLRMSGDLSPVFIQDVLGNYIMRKGNISTSNFYKRVLNMVRIKIIHRNKVSSFTFVYRTILTVLYHFLIPFIVNIKDFFKKIS